MFDIDYDKAANYWIEKDAENVRLPDEKLLKRIEGVIAKHKTCAFATAWNNVVRCTPLEFIYKDGNFYFFSEGGLKFRALKENKNVALSISSEYEGFGNLEGLQVTGKASLIEPFSEEYNQICAVRKIPLEAMKKLPQPMNLIKVIPEVMDLLDSGLKKEGFSSRQQWNRK